MIYLDNSATTKPFPSVIQAMQKSMEETYFNPSAAYKGGLLVSKKMEDTRRQIVDTLGGGDLKVYFTSGGTEADNLCIQGVLRARRGRKGHVITTAIEHPAVTNPFAYLKEMGMDVTTIGVQENGMVDEEALLSALREDTVLVSVMHVNNEVGSLQKIERLSKKVKEKNPSVLFHTDAVQAFMRVPFKMEKSAIDFYSLSGHKIHAPKGIGALVTSKNARFLPLLLGGGQEKDVRSGTENTPGIVGLGEAIRVMKDFDMEEMRKKRNYCKEVLLSQIKGTFYNGPEDTDAAPHILNLSFPVIRAEVLLHALEEDGVYLSAGSACSTKKRQPSSVLSAMGLARNRLNGALRISLCPETTQEEVEIACEKIIKNVKMLEKFKIR